VKGICIERGAGVGVGQQKRYKDTRKGVEGKGSQIETEKV
jgi:hypothetical protein